MKRLAVAGGWALALAVLVGLAALVRVERRAVAVDLATERDLHGEAYVGSLACRRCHEEHYRSWHRTFHRTMTQEVSARNAGAVLGDFSGVTYRHAGVDARMDRDASGAFRMTFTADGSHAAAVTAIVSRAIGSRRYQQYLTRIGDAEYRLPIAYHVEEKRWLHMNGSFLFSERNGDPAAPTREAAPAPTNTLQGFVDGLARLGGPDYARHVTRWNDNCVFCHNVAPNPGRDEASGTFRTEVAEMGVACEACHGPGGPHARANADPVRRYVLHLGGRSDPTIVNPSRLSPARAADLCGRCHGQRVADHVDRFLDHGDPFVPGDDLALWSAPLWQDTPLGTARAPFAPRFWADGTARLTAYEYQGLLQSPCTQRGTLTCTSCHGMHDGDPRGQLRPAAAGDGACTGCHRELAGADARARHSHHGTGTLFTLAAGAGSGVACVDCHMPRIVYGVLDVHRSHRIEVPDPARAAAYGRPDACTGCHADQTPAWAAAAARRWWGAGGSEPFEGSERGTRCAKAALPPKPVAGGSEPFEGSERGTRCAKAALPPKPVAGGSEPIEGSEQGTRCAKAALPPKPVAGGSEPIEGSEQDDGPLGKLLSGDPIERAVAADALGRTRAPAPALAIATRVGLLLETMANDDYPAVRHLAARALGRLVPGLAPLGAYDPNDDRTGERRAAVERVRASLSPASVVTPEPARVERLRAAAGTVAIEIGE